MGLKTIMSSSLALALFWGASALAAPSFIDVYVERIEGQGFAIQEVYQSLFGRYVIVAEAESGILEVVLDQHNGEILRERFTDRAFIDRKDTLGDDRRYAGTALGGGGDTAASEGVGSEGAGDMSGLTLGTE